MEDSVTTISREPIGPDLFVETPDGPRLLGGRHADGDITFPYKPADEGEPDVERIALPARGTVWTWSTQQYLPVNGYLGPETREDFAGFVFGYVDLPGACKVQTRLDVPVEGARESVAIGTEVELVLIPFPTKDGRELSTFAFRPVRSNA